MLALGESILFFAQPVAGRLCGICGSRGHYKGRCTARVPWCRRCNRAHHVEEVCFEVNRHLDYYAWYSGEPLEPPACGWAQL